MTVTEINSLQDLVQVALKGDDGGWERSMNMQHYTEQLLSNKIIFELNLSNCFSYT